MTKKRCACCEEPLEPTAFHILDPTETKGNQYSHLHCFVWQDHVDDASERIDIMLVAIHEAIEMMWEDGATEDEMEALIQSAKPNVKELGKLLREVTQNIKTRRKWVAKCNATSPVAEVANA